MFRTQANTSSFARDRVVEMHFWMMEVFFEPQYSYSRKMLTQLFMIVSVIDDLYDNNYCTTEDGGVFAAALQRYICDEFILSTCTGISSNINFLLSIWGSKIYVHALLETVGGMKQQQNSARNT